MNELKRVKQSKSGETSQLKSYCEAWQKAAENPIFQRLQLQALVDHYFKPSIELSSFYNLKLPMSHGQVYDAVVQLGQQGTQRLLNQVGLNENEMEWLTLFMDAREAYMNELGPAYQVTLTRIKSYRYLLQHPQDFESPLKTLNNDGQVMELKCDPSFTLPDPLLQQKFANSIQKQFSLWMIGIWVL